MYMYIGMRGVGVGTGCYRPQDELRALKGNALKRSRIRFDSRNPKFSKGRALPVVG